jgi:hypothetical protein
VPRALESEISALFQQRLQDSSLSSVTAEEIQDRLPVSLQIEVSRVTRYGRVVHCTLLRGCSTGFVDRLASLLHELIVEPESVLFRVGEASKMLYIVEAGALLVYEEADGAEGAIAAGTAASVLPGETAGEIAFVFGMRHMSSARAEADVESRLLTLRAVDLELLVRMFPDQQGVLMDNAMSQYDGERAQREAHATGARPRGGGRSPRALAP